MPRNDNTPRARESDSVADAHQHGYTAGAGKARVQQIEAETLAEALERAYNEGLDDGCRAGA